MGLFGFEGQCIRCRSCGKWILWVGGLGRLGWMWLQVL